MPQNISKLIDRGNKAFSKREYQGAQKLYERALELAPKNQTVIFNLAVAYQAQGDLDKAILSYEKAGGIADAKNNVGVIYEDQGELERAKEAYEAALKIEPDFALARENLLRLQKKIGGGVAKKLKPVTIADFSPAELELARASFAYQGLRKAMDNKVITIDDIKSEAEIEAKNVNLPREQRVHTVLLEDLRRGSTPSREPAELRDVNDEKEIPKSKLFQIVPNQIQSSNDKEITEISESRINTNQYTNFLPAGDHPKGDTNHESDAKDEEITEIRKLRKFGDYDGNYPEGILWDGNSEIEKPRDGVDRVNTVVNGSTQLVAGKVNTAVNNVDKENPMGELQQKIGEDFGPGWSGIDRDGDLLAVTEVTLDGWVKFTVDKVSGELDVFSYPAAKFLQEVGADSVSFLDTEEARELATDNLSKLNNRARISLMKKFHSKTMAALSRIKVKQREILEEVLKRKEEEKMQEVLAKIRGNSW